MIRVFTFITLRSLKNRLWSRLKRLREPRYLISAIFGLAYLWFMSFRYLTRQMSPQQQKITMGSVGVDLFSLVVLAMMIGAWALPGDKGGLEFSEAEIQFLFPAPVTRRQLLLYKIIRMQVPALFSSAVLAFIGFRRSNFLGFWLAFGVLSIYFLLTALGRARLRIAGVGFVTRLIAVVVILGAISWFVTMQYSALGFGTPRDAHAVFSHIDAPFHGRTMAAVLFVPKLFAGLALSRTVPDFLTNGAGVLALGVVFFFIATRLNVSFEEASIGASQRRLERVEKMRDRQAGRFVAFKRLPPPFALKPQHGPLIAIFWKNAIAALRISSAWIILVASPFMILAFKTIGGTGGFFSGGTALIALFMCAVIPLIAPDVFRQDLRFDLAHADLLKSYPISGERLVAAEMAAPLVIVAALELVLLTFASIVLHIAGASRALAFFATPQFIVIALLFAIPICAAQLLIRNAVAVFFPAWTVRAKDAKEDVRGFVATGQRLVVLIGNLFVLAVMLVPVSITFIPAFWAANHFFRGTALATAVATVPSAALLIFEVWFGIQLVGQQFERLDTSNEIQT